jgi:predicted secreted protein
MRAEERKAGLPTNPDAEVKKERVKKERKKESFLVQDVKCRLNEKDMAATCVKSIFTNTDVSHLRRRFGNGS